MVRPVSLNSAISVQHASSSAPASRRSRRSWSDDEKQKIIAEALLPGASVAEIARRHGVNANLVFNWRRSARTACSAGAEVAAPASDPEFIPIGVFARAPDGGPALIAGGGVAEQLPSADGAGSCKRRGADGSDRDRSGGRNAAAGGCLRQRAGAAACAGGVEGDSVIQVRRAPRSIWPAVRSACATASMAWRRR